MGICITSVSSNYCQDKKVKILSLALFLKIFAFKSQPLYQIKKKETIFSTFLIDPQRDEIGNRF